MNKAERKALRAANRICRPVSAITTQKEEKDVTKQNKLTEEAAKEKRRMETWQEIHQLTGSQAKIALVAILVGQPISEAIEIGKTYPA